MMKMTFNNFAVIFVINYIKKMKVGYFCFFDVAIFVTSCYFLCKFLKCNIIFVELHLSSVDIFAFLVDNTY